MRIGVYGSAAGDHSSGIRSRAREIGREIARLGHVVVTGACPGLPHEAVLGAREEGGRTVGFSPAVGREDHIERFGYPTEGLKEMVFVPANHPLRDDPAACLKCRNVASVASVDAAIFVGGATGTLNEFTIAWDLGRRIGVLRGSGGVADAIIPALLPLIGAGEGSVVFDDDPVRLVRRVTGHRSHFIAR